MLTVFDANRTCESTKTQRGRFSGILGLLTKRHAISSWTLFASNLSSPKLGANYKKLVYGRLGKQNQYSSVQSILSPQLLFVLLNFLFFTLSVS